ncbi:hypothetical protein FMM05_04865 [Flavobacterium zepuense]|uniref:Lipoprotein n=1 Tax=Flavobacterium zepuense TaxID=2593302 RepID=A0A552V8B9_9FLAO|nr:hypothetical protein [Flavobacterium zepuense]TRW26711.1 hypothetical protein FMM05_04865 [Flavobacterium zepuense]
MKKILLLTCLCIFTLNFSSCSNDDDAAKQGGSISFTINGEQHVFNDVTIHPSQSYERENEGYRSAFAGESEGNTSIRITFPVTDAAVNGNGLIEYMADNQIFFDNNQVTLTYTQNSNHKLKGTFSGTFTNGYFEDSPDYQERTITNGTFDITY